MNGTNEPVAGWYPDPANPSSQRWWDGTSWTDLTRPAVTGPALPPPPFVGNGQKPANHLVWAILSTVCCCVPVGIVSIVNAAKVDRAWGRGDSVAAARHSADAKKWAIIAAAAGIGLNVLIFAGQLAVGVAGG